MNIHELDSYDLGDAVRFHDQLNPRLWGSDEHLLPQVRDRLLTIAADFQEFLGVPDLDLEDITVSGSNAAYSYTPHSDIDLHLVVRVPDDDVYRELFDAKKFQYNQQHDIRIGGADVELYVQPADQPHVSQGIYSVKDGQWLSVPKRRRASINDSSVRHKYEDLGHRIEAVIDSGDRTEIEAMIERVKDMRKSGLATTGEFGPENLAFKLLRAQGLIKGLYDARNQARDRELSLMEKKKKRRRTRYGYGGYWFPGFAYGVDSGEGGGDGGGGESVNETGSTPDGVNPSTKMFLEDADDGSVVREFLRMCKKTLNIDSLPTVVLHRDPAWSKRTGSFGQFDPESGKLHVSLADRHIMDVLRTLAHELVHHQQNSKHRLPPDAGETGSHWENEANARAGMIMRDFAQQRPEIFGESSGYIPTEAERNDPRFSMALTQDIRPGETGRQANKLGLKTDSQGRPALLRPKR
jgi:hypothetical protein